MRHGGSDAAVGVGIGVGAGVGAGVDTTLDSRMKVALAEPPVPSLQVITFIPIAKVGVVATTVAANVPLAPATV